MRRPLVAALALAGLLVACGDAARENADVLGVWIFREDAPAKGYAELELAADGTYEGRDARSASEPGPDGRRLAPRTAPVSVVRGTWTRNGEEVRTTALTRNGQAVPADDSGKRVTLLLRAGQLRPRGPNGEAGPPLRRK
jgi:hypothetical protein